MLGNCHVIYQACSVIEHGKEAWIPGCDIWLLRQDFGCYHFDTTAALFISIINFICITYSHEQLKHTQCI